MTIIIVLFSYYMIHDVSLTVVPLTVVPLTVVPL